MRRLARSEKPRVAKEVVIKLYRTDDICIDDRARGAVPAAPVRIAIGSASGEENHLVVLANDDKRNFGLEA